MKHSILLLVIAFVFAACNKEHYGTQNVSQQPDKKVLTARVNQDNAFAFDLLKQTIKYSDESNVVVSPISVNLALGMAWNGANGDTKTEMETALQMSGLSVDEINGYYRYMQTTLPSLDPATKLNIANSIWYRPEFPVYPDFLKHNSTYFNSEIRELDFSQPKAVDIINNWCAQKTNNLIPKVLDNIPGDAVMYLINAIYFKGTWCTLFDAKGTHEANFTNEYGQQTTINMMNVKSDFKYTQDEYAQYLDMPYGNKSFSMTVILPKNGKTTDDLLNSLTLEAWNQRLEQLKSTNIEVSFPRFKVKKQFPLHEDILPAMGMKSAFENNADFSKISSRSIQISKILHDTYIEVTENGTEAAAVTTIEATETCMPQELTFIANKPFLFVIREQSSGIILFIGKMGNVEKF